MADWIWPCPGYSTITSGVGNRWGTTHKGIDILASAGAKVVASRSGVVTRAAYSDSYGYVVYIDHKEGHSSRYAHMLEMPMVSKGDRVSQGQQIGKVGSTGDSTGNHLHFEIRDSSGNHYMDPEKFVNPTNTTNNTPKSSNSNTNNGGTSPTPATGNGGTTLYSNNSNSTVSYSTASIIPIMTRDFTRGEPVHAYLKIFIGDRELKYEHGKPSIIQSFEIDRLENAGCRASFVIFDDNWDELEPYLADHWDNIHIEYGYNTGVKSPMYKMLLQDYSLDFNDTGVILNISAISEGAYQNLEFVDSIPTHTKNPTEAIKKICEHMGWDIDTSQFANLPDVDRENDYTVTNGNPVAYIQNVILKEALSDSGEIASFYLDALEKPTASLKIKTYGQNSNNIRTYVYQKGYDSVVESTSFDIKGMFGGGGMFQTVTGMRGSVFDTKTKQESSDSQDISTALTVSSGNYSFTRAAQSNAIMRTSGETAGQMNNKLYYFVKSTMAEKYEATMTIVGDPEIEILEEVRIINVTDYGSLHHTSGVYLVKGIVDSIDNGYFRTVLKLQRDGDISEGIEIYSPKALRS